RDGKSYYYLTDATGNVLALTDATGTRVNSYTYTPTGQPRTTPVETVPQPYRYAGTYLDPTGLYKMGARSYDPNLARFTTTDPSGQETNAYLYAEGDPVNRSDPSGLLSFGDVSGVLDWASLTEKVLSGDSKGAFAAEVGILVGIGTEAVCGAAAAAGAAPTLGASIGAGITGCTVLAGGLATAAAAGTAVAQ
ncbi:Wall-associated protein, partial [Streptomyces sp. CB01201]|uniref:RHS repeat-associated core domain-containing protein n=1 Tax=Streptomyces sp. CB01201 TaxID=2020324 RepID=UPI000CAD1874